MYYPRLDFDTNIVTAVRSASARVPDVAADYFEQTVAPALETLVAQVVAPYPPQRVPWGNGFASSKSRRWYFANRVPKGSKGGRYNRTGFLGASWVIRIDRRRIEGIITLRNTASYAEYVLGDVRQTPGHAATGWGGAPLAQGIAQVAQTGEAMMVDGWAIIVDRAIEAGL